VCRDEAVFLIRRSHPETERPVSCVQQTGDGENAVLFRSDLDAVMQPIPRLNGPARGSAMIEASAAILALISLAIFAAHALDAYRAG
jgi:hypothetical protein